MAAATPSAAQLIGEYLQSPDDLVKLAGFRRKLEREKASINAKLNAGIKEQVEATRQALSDLLGTRHNIQAIRDEMSLMDQECEDESLQVPTFDQMSRVSIVHRNFESTEEMANNLLEMETRLDQIEHMLDVDRRDLQGPAPDLLLVHYHLNQLARFRSETMVEARRASQKSQELLVLWFERLDKIHAQFDEYFGELAINILPLVQAGHSNVVVRLLKIAEFEGIEDQKAVALRFAMRAAPFRFRAAQADPRVLKNYRQRIMASIAQSIQDKLDSYYCANRERPIRFLEELNWLFKDIRRVEKEVVPCFPADYDIYSHYVRESHRAVHTVVQRIAETRLEGDTMLGLYEWIKHYTAKMSKLRVSPELLEPPLLDGKEQQLIEDYLQLIVQKLEEWTGNLMKSETLTFIERQEALEIDGDGLYCSQGAALLFQMVNQQIDLAIETGQDAVVPRVVAEVARVMRGTQGQWMKALQSELKKSIEKPEEAAPGLVDYSIALANDQIKSADYTEALLARLKPVEGYGDPVRECLHDAMDGYIDVAKKCSQLMVEFLFNDIKPPTRALFQPAWYDGAITEQITLTLRDYIVDFQSYLDPALLDPLIEELQETFLLTYLNAFAATTRFRMPAAAERMREDVEAVSSLFSTLFPGQTMEARFNILEHVQGMLDASSELFILSYWPFAKEHGPNLVFVENLIEARGDLQEKADIMEGIRERVEEEGIADPPIPTTMSKVVLPGLMSRAATAATRLLRN